MYPLPVRHGMTIGELALYFNATEKFGCDLTVVPMKEWKREWYFDETGLSFVPPSPNMPTLNTAIVYPGMCLVEATEISEGRGTTKPFEWIGAPYMDATELSNQLNKLGLEGITFSPIHFKPNFQKWSGNDCPGVQLQVTDRHKFEPFKTGLYLLKTIIELYPDNFQWREKPYEFVTNIPAIDLLTGNNEYQTLLSKNESLDSWMDSWSLELEKFREMRKPYLLYGS